MAIINLCDLDLNGNALIKAVIHPLSTAPSTAAEGQVYYDLEDNVVYVNTSTNVNSPSWVNMQAGDITGVTAGAGMTGDATSGAVTLNVVGGTGITANANDIAIDSTVATLSGSQTLSNKTIAASQVTEISNLTAAEGAQLEAIGTTTISATQWGYLGAATGAITNTDTQLSTEAVQDIVGAMTTGNTESGITVAYQDGDGTLDFTVGTLNQNTTGTAAGLSATLAVSKGGTGATNLNALVQTAGAQEITGAKTFSEHVIMGTNHQMRFRDTNSSIGSPTANDLEIAATTITLDAASDIQLEGATTVTGNLSVSGNLNIDGTTTTIDSTTVAIADSMLKLAKDQANTADALDFGFYGQYGVSGTHKYAGIFRDGSVTGDPFVFFDSLQAEPGTTVNTAGTGYDLADVHAGRITSADGFVGNLSGNVTGNTSGSSGSCTGNAATATALATSRNLQVALATTSAQGFTGAANATSIGVSGVLASANLDADTAHLTTTQTFTGAKTFTNTVALTGTGRITGIDTVSAGTDAANKTYVDSAITAARPQASFVLNNSTARVAVSNSNKTYTITHALGESLLYMVQVIRVANGSGETVQTCVTRTTTTVVINFNTAPTAGDYAALLIKF